MNEGKSWRGHKAVWRKAIITRRAVLEIEKGVLLLFTRRKRVQNEPMLSSVAGVEECAAVVLRCTAGQSGYVLNGTPSFFTSAAATARWSISAVFLLLLLLPHKEPLSMVALKLMNLTHMTHHDLV